MLNRSNIHQPFKTTRWSLVLVNRRADQPARRAALNELIEAYWYPLYAYLRRHNHDQASAEDLTQSFLASVIEKNVFAAADPARGRFRTFLLSSLQHFAINAHARERAAKRGGKRTMLSLDISMGETRYSHEPAHDLTPEKLYERRWAMTILDQALQSLEQQSHRAGKGAIFDALKPMLTGADSEESYADIARQLKMTADAVKTAALRLRRQYREILRQQIADTVACTADVDDELNHLLKALS